MKKFTKIKNLFIVCALLITNISRGQVLINEYSVSNFANFVDNFGGYEDWVELYNAGATPVNLTGYHLATKATNLSKWTFGNVTINAGGFLRIWASNNDVNVGVNLHTNFKLKQCQGDKIFFASPALAILDSATLKKTQITDSRGRTPNGSATWRVFANPTPNASNNTATAYLGYATTPVMSLAAGFYPGSQILTITSPDPGVTIRTTTTGSTPTGTNTIYVSAMSITTTQVVRAVATSTNTQILPSFCQNNTYFINSPHTVNVISVFGDRICPPGFVPGGTLLNGTQIQAESGLEYFDNAGVLKAESFGHSNEHGNDSWFYAQRGIDFICRDEFGYNDALKYQIFNSSPRAEFQRIIIKAAANDNYPFEGTPNSNFAGELGGAHIRDQYVHTVSQKAGMHTDARTWAPAVLYANGQYWGVYDVREKVDDKDYTKYYYGSKEDSLQFLQTWGATWSAYGGPQAQTDWNSLVAFVAANSMTNAANYAYVDSKYNIKSLSDYVILNSYVVCSDWLNWNTAWWRGLNYQCDKQKWRYMLWDEDATFKHYINYTNLPNVDPNADPCDPGTLNDPGGQGHIPIFNKLLTNPTFKQYYVMRYFDLLNTGLSCKRMTDILDSMVLIITPEMPKQIARWPGGSMAQWQTNVTALRNFIIARCDTVTKLFNGCYQTTGPYIIKINCDPPTAGTVEFNSVNIATFLWQGTYPGNLTNILKAHIKPNYCFSHWTTKTHTLSPNMTDSVVNLLLMSSDSIVAHFIPNPKPIVTPTSTNICEGTNIQLQASNGLNYSWLPSVGLSCTTCSNPIASPLATTIYTVTSTTSLSCSSSTSQTITVTANPQVLANPTSSIICDGNSVPLQATNGSGYTWLPSAGLSCTSCANPIASPSVTTIYTVTSTNSLSCSSSLSITVTVTANPQVLASTSSSNICIGNSTPLQATNGGAYSWLPSVGLSCTTCSNPIANPSVTTIYTVTSNTSANCNTTAASLTVNVIPYAGAAFTATNTVSQFPQSLNVVNTSISASTYSWTLSNGSTSTGTVPAFVVTASGTYTLVLIAYGPNGCNDTTSSIIFVDDVAPLQPSIVIPNVFTPNGDGVNDFFLPIIKDFADMECSIYDRWGIMVHKLSGINDKWSGETEKGKECPAGTYFYVLTAKDMNKKNYVYKGYVNLFR